MSASGVVPNGLMASSRNPFQELERLFEQMQENVEEASKWWNPEQYSGTAPKTMAVNVDIEDRDDELVLTAELAGFEKDDIDVRVTGNTFHLEAEREAEATETEADFVRRERHRASVSRSLSLPTDVRTEEITATYENGLLTVRMPKTEPLPEGTKIDVN